MNRNTTLLTLLVAATPFLGACDQSSVGPQALDPVDVPVVMDAELEISINSELTAAAVEDVQIALGPQRGPGPRARIQSATDHFSNARRRYAAGDPAGARAAGKQAREALSEAVILGLGASEVGLMIAEVEATVATLSINPASYSEPSALSATLSGLVDAAKADQQRGRDKDAGAKMVRARQHTDRARRDSAREHDGAGDVLKRDVIARLQVAQGAAAINLAWGLIGSSPNELQARLMGTASELQRKAEVALAEGHLGRAASLAHTAEVKSLQAVIGSDVVADDLVTTVAGLAEGLLAEATAVVGSGASAIDLAILQIANRLFEGGLEQLAAGKLRGLALLWSSATISTVLIG